MADAKITITAQDNTRQATQTAQQNITSLVTAASTGFMAMTNAAGLVGNAVSAVKDAFVDLAKNGINASDELKRFSVLLGSENEAQSLLGAMDKLDDITLATKDDLSAFSQELIVMGKSQTEIQNILAATVNISNTSGRTFSEVQGAMQRALTGSTTAIEKIMPELKNLGKEAYESGDAFVYINDKLEEASVTIASGQFAQKLDAISTSWTRIKESIGATIVANIESTGILDGIYSTLKKVEENTAKKSAEKNIGEDAMSFYMSKYNEYRDAGFWTKDAATAAYRDLEAFAERNQWTASDISNFSDYYRNQYLKSHGNWSGELDPFKNDVVGSWAYKGYVAPASVAVTESASPFHAPNDMSTMMHGTSLVYGSDGLNESVSYFEKITSGDWGSLTESDWAKMLSVLNSVDEDIQDVWWPYINDGYVAWLMYNNPEVPSNPLRFDSNAMLSGTRGANRFVLNGNGEYVPYWQASGSSYESGMSMEEQIKLEAKLHAEAMSEVLSASSFPELMAGIEKVGETTTKEEAQIVTAGFTMVASTVNSLASAIGRWKDGYNSGDLGGTISDIGGIVSMFSPEYGALISAGGYVVSGLEQLFDSASSDETTSASASVRTATYNGATTIHINNYFDGSYIVGSGGMSELADIIGEELNNKAYTRTGA